MSTGLNKKDKDRIINILKKYPTVHLVHLFGSRATGNYKPGSDIDLAIINTRVDENTIKQIKSDLEESSLPYFVDIVYYPDLKHEELRTHIDSAGVVFYNN
ncbi:MAG: nucleotidyltransferase domain-containing protein [Sphingobacteriaceae bacterium]|nr:MAG: nucleotidyltransferase domain-containing protein [Sphingobacteriaceae bacterium]